MKIIVISSSVRIDRKSHRVALYFQKYIADHNLSSVEMVDLEKYNFPIFKDKLKNQINPTKDVLEFAEKIKSADGIIIVTPEYNGGYPASLKNAIDLLYEEWYHKPIAISTTHHFQRSDAELGLDGLPEHRTTHHPTGSFSPNRVLCRYLL